MKSYIYKDGYKHKAENLCAKEIDADEKQHGLLKGVYITGKGFVETWHEENTGRTKRN